MTALLNAPSTLLTVPGLAGEFDVGPGYLAAATCGVVPRRAVEALQADLERWRSGRADPGAYDNVVARTRASYARVAGVPVAQVAIGSQTSALVANIAASLLRVRRSSSRPGTSPRSCTRSWPWMVWWCGRRRWPGSPRR
ncbi:MAG: hypothetical protein QM779_17950 [Propionicimonas sp.]|uniref:hypothetical protein n=1 Tax=Propionicimonas sp. TaxID=1955623 RepID=UPI003D0E3401